MVVKERETALFLIYQVQVFWFVKCGEPEYCIGTTATVQYLMSTVAYSFLTDLCFPGGTVPPVLTCFSKYSRAEIFYHGQFSVRWDPTGIHRSTKVQNDAFSNSLRTFRWRVHDLLMLVRIDVTLLHVPFLIRTLICFNREHHDNYCNNRLLYITYCIIDDLI